MSRFNTPTISSGYAARTPDTTNLAGGTAWSQDAELELASLVTTSMVNDQYYRSAEGGLQRMRELVAEVPYFAAQAAVYARNEDGLRSISHAVAGEVAHLVKGEAWTKNFVQAVVRRPDDVTEILSYYLGNYGKPLPNSLKKGLGAALGKFDQYQLAKYRGENQGLSLVDAVNLVHPRPTDKNRAALKLLVDGQLRSERTFEAKLSAAGPDQEAKRDAWASLLDGSIGYMALLKNLRNIAEQAPELIPQACELLTNEKAVQKSLVLPFRFITAMRQLQAYPKLLLALSQAVDLSLSNIPDLGQNVLVAVDGSASMGALVTGNQELTRNHVGALFGAALYKKNFADVVVFGATCGPVRGGLNPADSTLTNAEQIANTCYGHSTNFQAIFDTARRGHDTVVIFSDMQAWVDNGWGCSHPGPAFENYKRRYHVHPKVFAFDLSGYGTAQFPERDVFQLAGFSDSSLGLMAKLREDPRALVNSIKQVSF